MKIKSMLLGFLLIFSISELAEARVSTVLLAKGNVKKHDDVGNHSKKNIKSDDASLVASQTNIIKSAVRLAKEDGFKKPKVLGAIVMQESKAGTAHLYRTANHKKSFDKTVGLGQIKAPTARHVLNAYPELIEQFNISKAQLNSNSFLLKKLGFDDNFNLAIASKYLIMLYKIKPDINWVIAAYNMGPGNAMHVKHPEKNEYVKLVNSHLPIVKDAISI